MPTCNHPIRIRYEIVPAANGTVRLVMKKDTLPPAEMLTCKCGENAVCPVCGFGWGASPCGCDSVLLRAEEHRKPGVPCALCGCRVLRGVVYREEFEPGYVRYVCDVCAGLLETAEKIIIQ